jgi:dGTPase
MLAAYASNPTLTRGRRFTEPPAPTRNEHQRDRDRIVHSTAFRRLVYKTQVFINHEGDLFRTRLTHSLEVAQLGRSIARSLQLNEDLVEAVALAHDLGHTPFGHVGQDALNACMKHFGGFEHNLQSLRVVDVLEERYAAFDGLNLTFEAREGILKHCSHANAEALEVMDPHGVGRRFLVREQPSLEAQLCNLADEIAYNAHDIDDGVRSGLLTLEQVTEVPLFQKYRLQAEHDHPELRASAARRRLLYESIRRMLSEQVYDVISETQKNLAHHQPENADAVRKLPSMVAFSEAMREQSMVLKRFLFQNLYRHSQVMETMGIARQVLTELFDAYCQSPTEMPSSHSERTDSSESGVALHRVVADYVAGMTDRFAMREHERLTGRRLWN